MSDPVCETPRLVIRLATRKDATLVHSLWTDPRVMANVGFPNGLPVTVEQLRENIARRGKSAFQQLLIVELKGSGQPVGQCLMSLPDENGISTTDIKLLPEFWGNHYGVEVKRALVSYLFEHTFCVAVEATPNVGNTASIKMQEAVGGVRVSEGIFRFPESMRAFTQPVHHYVYRVYRKDWRGM